MPYATVEIDKTSYMLVNFGPPDDPLVITWWGCEMCRSYHYAGKFYARIDADCEAHRHVIFPERKVLV